MIGSQERGVVGEATGQTESEGHGAKREEGKGMEREVSKGDRETIKEIPQMRRSSTREHECRRDTGRRRGLL